MVIDMKKMMRCPGHMCDGTIGLIRAITKRSCVTHLETETYLVGCDICTLRQRVDMGERVMSDPELNRLSKPEEYGYEHG